MRCVLGVLVRSDGEGRPVAVAFGRGFELGVCALFLGDAAHVDCCKVLLLGSFSLVEVEAIVCEHTVRGVVVSQGVSVPF